MNSLPTYNEVSAHPFAFMTEDLRFEPATLPASAYNYQTYMAQGLSKRDAKRAAARVQEERVVLSDTYQVNLSHISAPAPFGTGVWLSCKRRDKAPLLDRRALGRIKDALAPSSWGLELYPASDRVVDTANQYHLWTFEGPCFFLEGTLLTDWKACSEPAAEFSVLSFGADSELPHMPVLRLGDGAGGLEQDWRKLQAAKDRLMGNREAAMLYAPADVENPLADMLIVLPSEAMWFPFGFRSGLKQGADEARHWGARQREF